MATSFVEKGAKGKIYAPGWFLAHEECVRKTYQASVDSEGVVTDENGGKYLPMGTLFKVDGEAVGLVYEDCDVTANEDGAMPCSVVTSGVVYEDRLPDAEAAKEALVDVVPPKGFTFVTSPKVTRP